MRLSAATQLARSAPGVFTHFGLTHSLRLIKIYLLDPACQALAPWTVRAYLKQRVWLRWLLAVPAMRIWEKRWQKGLLSTDYSGCATLASLGLSADHAAVIRAELADSAEADLGSIDQDGFLLTRFDSVTAVPTVTTESYLERKRFNLRLVILNTGFLGIKKHFRGDRLGFLRELEALSKLANSEYSVPRILDLNFNEMIITLSFIPGPVLREELAKAGARLRGRELHKDPGFYTLSPKQRQRARIEAVKTVLNEVVDEHFIGELFRLMRRIHSRGVILRDIKYGNVIIDRDTGNPSLIDFEAAITLSNPRGWACRTLRDRDIERFNRYFFENKLTYATLKERLRTGNAPISTSSSPPIYFGWGLRTGGSLWNIEEGIGRWHFILKSHLPRKENSRILDLGSTDGVYVIELLRRGAAEVLAVATDEERAAQVQFVREAFEWADNRTYNLKVLHAKLADVASMDVGRFDTVLALGSAGCLEDEDMANLIRYTSKITDCLVWQLNLEASIDPKRQRAHKGPSAEDAVSILRQNGFPVTKTVAPRGYSRPLIIGNKN